MMANTIYHDPLLHAASSPGHYASCGDVPCLVRIEILSPKKASEITMHRLSVVMGIIEPASLEAEVLGAPDVQEIWLILENRGGIGMERFDFECSKVVKGTIPLGKERKINLRIN